jgi:nitrite reductase (NO-forming)
MSKNTKTIIMLIIGLSIAVFLSYLNIKNTPKPIEENKPLKNIQGEMTEEGVRVFNISGRNFTFSQSEMKVKKGEKIKVIFKSTKGYHDWILDEFNVRTEKVEPGKTTTVEFIANKVGTFEYYCSTGEHRKFGMTGKLIVEE